MARGGGGIVALAGMPGPLPQPAPAPAPPPSQAGVAEVPKVRSHFPETWIWTDVSSG